MKKNKIILVVVLFLTIVFCGIFLFNFISQKISTDYNLKPSKPVVSSWLLPDNDGIGEASLFLYKDNSFELMNKDDRRYGNWKMIDTKTLELAFTDEKQKYDKNTNVYFENTKVIDPYTLKIKIIPKPSPYLDFFNYFFYKK